MGVAKLKKSQLYYHKSVHSQIAEALQKSQACQIISSEQPDNINFKASPEILALLSKSEENLSDIRYLMRSLSPHFVDPIPSLDRMLGERPEVSIEELAKLSEQTDLKIICEKTRAIEQKLAQNRLELSQAKTNRAILDNLDFFQYPLSILTEGTKTLKGVIGTVKTENAKKLKAALGDFSKFASEADLTVASYDEKEKPQEIYAALIYSRKAEKEILDVANKNGFSSVEISSDFKGTVTEEKELVMSKISELEALENSSLAEIKNIAQENMPTIQKLSDYWLSMNKRWQEISKSENTDTTMFTEFWIPESECEKLKSNIEAISSDVELVFSDPSPDEEPPTLLNNGNLTRPFNILTELYSPPTYRGIDPTPLLAPFFFIFFGMCLGDAGYAIVLAGTIWYVFRKYKKIPAGIKDFITLFAYCSVSTLIYGIISGSFFGNFIDSFVPILVPFKNALMLVDPMTNPMQVLGISLLLGVVHLMFGLLIAAYDKIRYAEFIDALGSDISWFLLIVGLCFYGVGIGGMLPAHFVQIGQAMAILGAVIIFIYAGKGKPGIFNKIISGFLALYGSTSYLGDILSYSRLLALGFGSAVIGMVINLLGGLAADIPYVGWLVAIVVIIGGHIFSILINILGSFVHPLRLQYVEFFGKFYTGGGESFTPLTLSQEFVTVKS